MSQVYILEDERCSTLKSNIKFVNEKILNSENNEWLKEFFQTDAPFKLSKIDIKDFEMDMTKENPAETDLENAKRLYENLKITESQALDERLWTGLAFSKFYDYMKYRYPSTEKSIKNKWLFQGYNIHSDAFRQGLSMLWWYVYLTYDKNAENPYELTDFGFKHKDIIISLYSRNFSGSKNVRFGILRALKNFEDNGGNLSQKETYDNIFKYISFLGGAYIIDIMSEKEIYDRCTAEIIRLASVDNKQNKFKL